MAVWPCEPATTISGLSRRTSLKTFRIELPDADVPRTSSAVASIPSFRHSTSKMCKARWQRCISVATISRNTLCPARSRFQVVSGVASSTKIGL